ncbi:cytochrome ubiquinol oxidase subunit I [Nocardia yunnanensis]|uniref:Cytochrome ubiquinol oxidase subunit I n=1 Tax=Nocardia yunnanensis TaxID=2382165 RepID=A0A386ZL20_9NOCA|nr:cytochrome ubiquinol oxidase subunit I [Nocardia yunnanensis]AYF77285.1 cytochrome ubiquinol oxidase subunit I [Nocardia yunnanensis]
MLVPHLGVVDLARLQFAGTTAIHWLFVLLTLGVVPVVAAFHTCAAFTRDPVRRAARERATRFWGQLYVINYAVGIVTGLVMEFQFGLAWSGLSKVFGNVIGAPIALETLVAFFAESTFLGMWIFGWGRLRPWLHAGLLWVVTLTAYASAYFILVSNGFMQHPVGFETREGTAHLTDLRAVLTNPSALYAFAHVSAAAVLCGGVFLAGVSAYHVARRSADRRFFLPSLRVGLVLAALASYPVYRLGVKQYPLLGRTQPMKLAAGKGGPRVAKLQDAMAAQHGPGDYVPPAWIAHAEEVMLRTGMLTMAIVLLAVVVVFHSALTRFPVIAVLFALGYPMTLVRTAGGLLPGVSERGRYGIALALVVLLLVLGGRVARRPATAWLLVAAIPLPFLASVGGWVFREVGRQPWLVYGQLTVDEAVSHVSVATMWASCIAFLTVFAALALTDWALIARFAARGPAGTQLGAPEPVDPITDAGEFARVL